MELKQYKRWNAARKAAVAIALLKGEPLEEVSRATGQPAHRLKRWKQSFLEGGHAAFQAGESAREKAQAAELKSLKAKVGELVMDGHCMLFEIVIMKTAFCSGMVIERQTRCAERGKTK